MRLSLPCAVVIGLASVVSLAPAQDLPPDAYRLKVSTELVLVPASVSTPDGRPITTLPADAFEVLENGKPRPVKLFERETGRSLQLALLVDASLSTAIELPAEKKAMARFIQRVLRPTDAAALYEFSGGARALTGFSSDTGAMERALQTIRPRAGTSLFDAIVESSGKLKSRAGRRVLVLVTDGSDTSSEHDFHEALRAAQEAEASIFSLVIRPVAGESGRSLAGEHRLMTFAELTGGRAFFVSRAAEMDQFFDDVDKILRTQYLLGFEPSAPGLREELRSIEVRVKGANYQVQHRKGYYSEPVRR